MGMHNPPHPGEIIKSLCLEPLGVSVTQAAKALGVSRKTLSAILNGLAGISPEMAVRKLFPLRLLRPLKAGSISKRSMIFGMRNGVARSFGLLSSPRHNTWGQISHLAISQAAT